MDARNDPPVAGSTSGINAIAGLRGGVTIARDFTFQAGHDVEEIADRSGVPVELGDNEAVTLPDVIQDLVKLISAGDRGNLLDKHLLAADTPKLPLLGFQPGHLSDRGRPRIADQHGRFCLTRVVDRTIPYIPELSTYLCETGRG